MNLVELRRHILAGESTKDFALSRGLHPTAPGKQLAALGIRKVYITEEEHESILAARKATENQQLSRLSS